MILRQIFLETLFEADSREFILTIQSIVPIYNIKVFKYILISALET